MISIITSKSLLGALSSHSRHLQQEGIPTIRFSGERTAPGDGQIFLRVKGDNRADLQLSSPPVPCFQVFFCNHPNDAPSSSRCCRQARTMSKEKVLSYGLSLFINVIQSKWWHSTPFGSPLLKHGGTYMDDEAFMMAECP